MVVCLCKGVSDKTIRGLVQNGASTLREVALACRAGTDCGSCVCQVRELIELTRTAGGAASGSDDLAANQDSSLRICCAK